jgi:geranylgeranyl diphosphate/geranylgeranyl-bacteriochlorophyllide a reductase
MVQPIQTVAVIGGGPAGSTLAERLLRGCCTKPDGSARSRRTDPRPLKAIVFEEKRGWEKPCGGGLTAKALKRYPFLADAMAPGNAVGEMEVVVDHDESLRFRLREPITVYSRRDLNALLLRRAERAGAQIVQDRITRLGPAGGHWRLQGLHGAYDADFVAIAAGARTRLRGQFAGDLPARDFMLTYGYYVPQQESLLRVMCFRDFDGYAWSFPRTRRLSVGICGKAVERTMPQLKRMLHCFMRRFSYSRDGAEVFAHLLPSLSIESWRGLKLAGHGWALAGDAAGLVDPITGEGIYFAMRSGELLAESLLEQAGAPDVRPLTPAGYTEKVRAEIADDLMVAARARRYFYRSTFMGEATSARMLQLAGRSRAFMILLQDMIEGQETYSGLVRRISLALPKAAWEVAARTVGGHVFNDNRAA